MTNAGLGGCSPNFVSKRQPCADGNVAGGPTAKFTNYTPHLFPFPMISPEEISNFELFRDCVSAPLIENFTNDRQTPRVKRRGTNGRKKSQPLNVDPAVVEDDSGKDAEELADFIDVSGPIQYLLHTN